jgi:CheY-like chemotaxis protein
VLVIDDEPILGRLPCDVMMPDMTGIEFHTEVERVVKHDAVPL